MEKVNNESIPSHATTVQEGNNDDSESYHGPEKLDVQRNDEPRSYYKYKDFMTCKTSSFNGKEDPVGVMNWIS